MNILFIGGTKFVGRHAADAAVRRGHRVTVLHRGKTPSQLEGVEEIRQDRMDDLSSVAARQWDAVLDSCGYVPRVVQHSAHALRKVDRYLFVSTISVYEDDGAGGLRVPVKAPLHTEEITGETYGPLKLECENVVREVFGDRALLVRPGLVAGPHDPTNRFTYWVERLAGGGRVLVPDVPDAPLELIDARDLGEFNIVALEKGLSGTYDVAGEPTTFGAMVQACHLLDPATEIVQVSEGFLEAEGIKLWSDLPLAVPSSDAGALMRVSSAEAVAQGLTRRPLIETARDTHEWAKSHPAVNPPYGMSRDRELAVIASTTAPPGPHTSR